MRVSLGENVIMDEVVQYAISDRGYCQFDQK